MFVIEYTNTHSHTRFHLSIFILRHVRKIWRIKRNILLVKRATAMVALDDGPGDVR